jgi:hypothetical protein
MIYLPQHPAKAGLLVEYLGGLHFATAKSSAERKQYERGLRRLTLVAPDRLRKEIQIYLKAGDDYTARHVDIKRHWISLVGPMRRIDVGILNRLYFRNLPKPNLNKRTPWFGPSLTLTRDNIWRGTNTQPRLTWRPVYTGLEEGGYQALEEFDYLRGRNPAFQTRDQISLSNRSDGKVAATLGKKLLFETYRSDNNNRVWHLKNGGLVFPSDTLNYVSPFGRRFQFKTDGIFDPRLVIDSNRYVVFDTGFTIPGEYIPERDGAHLFRSLASRKKFTVVRLSSGSKVWTGSLVTQGVPVGIINDRLTCVKLLNLKTCLISPKTKPECVAIEYSVTTHKAIRKQPIRSWNQPDSDLPLSLMQGRPINKSTATWTPNGNVFLTFGGIKMSSKTKIP